MSKSIFEKSYILKAQAIKAMEKEFGVDSHHEVVLKEGVIPARYVIVEKAPVMADDLPSDPSELDFPMLHAKIDAKIDALEYVDAERMAKAEGMKHGDAKAYLKELHPDDAERALSVAPWAADEQAKADKLAHALQVNAELPASKPKLSTCEKPTKKVWHIADSMPKASRKEVIEECVRQGIAYGTSRTQYQAWFKASQEAMRGDIRKPYEKA